MPIRSPAPFVRRQRLLVTYDVDTTTSAGRRRLRRVAKLCESIGQRVQFSVFECTVTPDQREAFVARVHELMDPAMDSVRIYRLPEDRDDAVHVYGRDTYRDFDEPLIL
jgi:CRISPR-associated protein Cas2